MSQLSQKKSTRKSYPPIKAGDQFGKLTALDAGTLVQGSRQRHRMINVRCECGVEKQVRAAALNSGITKSCGCGIGIQAALNAKKYTSTHGMSSTPIYGVYRTMLSRCYNPNVERYPIYGGRGIKVCDRWRGEGGFENFLADMGERPDGHSIERLNSDGDYSPSNCIWADARRQANNTRRNRMIAHNGQNLTLAQWERRTGIPRANIAFRLKSGWSVEKALTAPVRGKG